MWPVRPSKNGNAALVLRRLAPGHGYESSTRLAEAHDALEAWQRRWAVRNLTTSRWWEHLLARRRRAVQDLTGSARELHIELASPLAIGIGGAGAAVEGSLLVHPTHGYPLIPGSSIKGAALAFGRESGADCSLLGSAAGVDDDGKVIGHQGVVTFHDAVPAGPLEIEVALMTPHSQEYCADGEWPADYLAPVPISFLVVERGTFVTHLTAGDDSQYELDLAARLVQAAGIEIGFGAKTAAGYGYSCITITEVHP